MRRVGVTTWLVLVLCLVVGVVAVAMTVVVVVRLNRQILASAAELRAGLGSPAPAADPVREELLQYAASRRAIENAWADAVADYRLRYPNDAIYSSVITAQTVRTINQMRRPAIASELHERWAQAWSDRDAALAILANPNATAEERQRANELARAAGDQIRRVNNELDDLLVAQGITVQETASGVAARRPP